MAHSPVESKLAKLSSKGARSTKQMKRLDALNGPMYQLANSPTAYRLPPPGSLKPFFDTKAGVVDTWPAHASSQNVASRASLALNRNKELVVVNDDVIGRPQITHRPRFLEQLDAFLKKELRVLGCTKIGPSELRLQAHREVFEYLIEDFKTYKPLLAAIKNEYEMMLAYQREMIRQAEPLKQMLVTVSEKCEMKIMAMRNVEKQEIIELKEKIAALYRRITEMQDEQKDLHVQVNTLKDELASEYERYRDQCDARKLLVADINDLRYQEEDMALSKQGMNEEEDDNLDSVTLRIALKKAREDEAQATMKLMEMQANYGDVIPRRDYEALNVKYNKTVEDLETSRDDFNKLREEHEVLLDTYRQALQQRDEYFTDCERMRVNATPRPDWDKCADFIVGGLQRWSELSQGKSSDDRVDILLNEIIGNNSGGDDSNDMFQPRGLGEEVPKYLRTELPIKNRRLGKRDCALLIKDVWKEKLTSEDSKCRPLDEYLYGYLSGRFGIEQLVMEWGYNLLDASYRFSHDDRFGTFHAILNKEMAEEIYHDQINLIRDLYVKLTQLDTERGAHGKLSKDDVRTTLAVFFPELTDEGLTELMSVAEQELDGNDADVVEYNNLFLADDEGKTGAFVEEIKKKQKQRRYDYVNEIKENLMTPSLQKVAVADLQKAITQTDPQIDQSQLNDYLCWAFAVNEPAQLAGVSPIELGDLIVRLQNGNLHRIGASA